MSAQLNVYSYYDASGGRVYADYNDVVFTGTWSVSVAYASIAKEIVNYGPSQYICITDNTGVSPIALANPIRYWSPFVLVSEGGGTISDPTYQLALSGSILASSAYSVATSGSTIAVSAANGAATAQVTANSAYTLAIAGTQAGNSALSAANGAYAIAVAGTSAGTNALNRANEAYALAQIGTNVGTSAYNLATTGSNLAWVAYTQSQGTGPVGPAGPTGINGTNGINGINGTNGINGINGTNGINGINGTNGINGINGTNASEATAIAAYALAQIGTNVGTNAYNLAASGSNTAWSAYVIAVAGTNAAAAATNTANGAYNLAVVGTNSAATATSAYNLAVTGTNVATAGSNMAYATYLSGLQAAPKKWTPVFVGGVTYKSNPNEYWKATGVADWTGQVYSLEGYARSVYCSAKALLANASLMFGLNSNPSASTSGADVDYCLQFGADGNVYIHENGVTAPGTFGTWNTTTVLDITYDGVSIKYWVNGAVVRTVARSVGAALYFESWFYSVLSQGITSVDYGPIINNSTGSSTIYTADQAYALAQIGTNVGTNAYNLANAAYTLAVSGTNVGTNAYNLAQSAYNIAVAGTSAGAAMSRANEAYYLAQIGTNVGTNAYNLANNTSSLAQSAFNIAVIGTNAAATAQNRADAAYVIAVSGTNVGTNAYNLAQSAYNIAVAGTSAGTAMSRANEAYALASIGTNVGTNAYNLAQTAYTIAIAGTMTGNLALQIAIAGTNLGTSAYNLATTGSNLAWVAYTQSQGTGPVGPAGPTGINGTNGINGINGTNGINGINGTNASEATAIAAYALAQIGTNVGTNAYNLANAAYTLAVSGTNVGTNAYNLAQSAYNIAVAGTSAGTAMSRANEAYALAVIGTNAASTAQLTANGAFVIAVAGTGAAAVAQSRADAAYGIAVTGTNTATAGSNLAWAAYTMAGTAGGSTGTNTRAVLDWIPAFVGGVVQGPDIQSFTKITPDDVTWGNFFKSTVGYLGGVECSFMVASVSPSPYGYFGLTADPSAFAASTDSFYFSISAVGSLGVTVGLVGVANYGIITSAHVLKITYDGAYVKFWINDALYRTVARTLTGKLYLMGVMRNNDGSQIRAVNFRPSEAAVAHTYADKAAPKKWTPVFVGGVTYRYDANSYWKATGVADWTGQVYSTEGYIQSAYCSAKLLVTSQPIIWGLCSTPTNSTAWAEIDYCFRSGSDGNIYINEKGVSVPTTYGTWNTTTRFDITYNGVNVKYFVNGIVVRTVARAVGAALYFNGCFTSVASQGLVDVDFGQLLTPTVYTADNAYALAAIGTNVGTNAYNLASAGSNVAWQAYTIAVKGTTTPIGAVYSPNAGAQTVALDCSQTAIHIVNGHGIGSAITFTMAGDTNNQPIIVSVAQGTGTVSTIGTWFSTIRWAGGTAPTLTATVSKRDTFAFLRTGSNTYDGFIAGQNC